MDAEKLKNEVHKRLPLWDQRNKEYRDRDKVEKLWHEVAVELNVSKEAAKKRWKSLRDVFRNELKKLPKPKSGDGTPSDFTSKWAYFKLLVFLKDQMAPRPLTGNLPTDKESSQINEENLFVSDIDEEAPVTPVGPTGLEELLDDDNQTENTSPAKKVRGEERTTDCTNPPKRSVKRAAKRKEDFDIDHFLKLEQEKIDILKTNSYAVLSTQSQNSQITQDDDYHFLMSFHRPLQNMRFETKMWFRFKMQELLYQTTVNQHFPTTSFASNMQTQHPRTEQTFVGTPLVSPTYSTESNMSYTNL